jgi:hypothetical protein
MNKFWLPLVLLASAATAAGGSAAARAQAIYNPPPAQNFEGVWLIQGDHAALRTIAGKLPPMNQAAAARYLAAVKSRRAGKPDFDTIQTCKPRMVYLDMALPKLDDMDPNWMGLSVGHWDGDTLVVETQGFNDLTTLDTAGLPHSTQMHVSERIRKTAADTLEDVITIADPKTFTETWSTRVTYRRQPGLRLKEYVCTDSNPEALSPAAGRFVR